MKENQTMMNSETLFCPRACFRSMARLAVLCLAAVVSLAAHGASPSFFVTVTTSTSPPVNELLLVTVEPFGLSYSVVTVTNSENQTITNGPGDAALDFSPDGALYGAAGDILSIINPSNASASNVVRLSNAATASVAGAALAFGNNGAFYLSDGYSLYSVDDASGLCTLINTFHTNGPKAKLTTPIYGLAVAPNGTLFGGDLDLYTINPANAAATPIGTICAYPWFAQAQALAFGSDGNLYMIGQNFFGEPSLYSVDTNDAVVTLLGALPGQAFGLVNSINPVAPAITGQPVSQTVVPGGTAIFSVTASGAPAPAPSWYFDNAAYPFATNHTLTITNVSATNAGSYFVVLTNSSGAITSDVVTLTVTNNIAATNFTFLATAASGGNYSDVILSLSTNPVSETVLAGGDVPLTCLSFNTNNVLYGGGNILYTIDTNSWSYTTIGTIETSNGTPLTLSSMAFSPQNALYGVAGNSFYSINTGNALATVTAGYPEDVFISAIAFGPNGVLYGGEDDLYMLEATNGALLSKIGTLLPSTTILSDMKVGADGYLYFGNGEDMNLYRLNPLTAAVSKVASFNSVLSGLAFYPAPFDTMPPAITSAVTNPVAALGGTITFSVTATGAGPLTYRWRTGSIILQDGSRISGSATSALTISDLMLSDAGSYTLTVSNVFGSVTLVVANLTVGAGPVITIQPAATTRIDEGKSLDLKVTASGGTTASPLLYQWMQGDTIIPGASSRTLSMTASPSDGLTNLFYTVFVRNSFGVALSAPAQVSILKAKLATNQFFGLAGVYNGLFSEIGGVTEETAGIISGLSVTNTGVFSGLLVLEGLSHHFSGSFNAAGQSSNYIARPAGGLIVQMNFMTNAYPNQIFGSVSSLGWQSDIHLIAKAAAPLPSAAATMILPPPANFAGGYGYAVITNHAGSVSFAGKLADGATFNPTAGISQSNSVALYASLYGNTGILTGWLDFDTGVYGDQVPQGQLTWIRKRGGTAGSLYSSGFTNVVTVQGSTWVEPPAGVSALPVIAGDYNLQIVGGNLANPLSFLVAIGSKNILSNVPAGFSTNSLAGSINPKTGLLTVIFGNGHRKATTTGTGVVLQNSTNAFGAFLGTTNSGSFILQPAEP
jgi:hypothetical protein